MVVPLIIAGLVIVVVAGLGALVVVASNWANSIIKQGHDIQNRLIDMNESSRLAEFDAIGEMFRKMAYGYQPSDVMVDYPDGDDDEEWIPEHEVMDEDLAWIRQQLPELKIVSMQDFNDDNDIEDRPEHEVNDKFMNQQATKEEAG